MKLSEQIDQDIKTALKEKNETAIDALRNLKAAIQNAGLEKKSELTEEEVLKTISKKVKQHKDSIESFNAGNRKDLADKEIAQMAYLEKYLPKQLSEDEVRKLVKDAIVKFSATSVDFGKVMKEVVAQAAGRTDGTVISKIVKEELS